MTAKSTKTVSDNPDEKSESGRRWLTGRLRKPNARQAKESEDIPHTKHEISLPRPQTAPSSGMATKPLPPLPPLPTLLEPPLARPLNRPPPRPPRPDSGVIRDVNAWLEASMIKPAPQAPQLMGGIDYWREGVGSRPSGDVRYAIPILQSVELDRPPSHGQPLKSFCRRAKKLQVRMPSLLRTRSQKNTVTARKQSNRRSTSMPILSTSSDGISESAQRPLTRCQSMEHRTENATSMPGSSQPRGWIRTGRLQLLGPSQRPGTSAGARFDNQESSMERHVNAVFGQTSRLGDDFRPPISPYRSTREDSVGNISDAPTYSSGPPPPSYRSRAASVRTTSSFGCIDAMNTTRQLHPHLAEQHSRGVKGRLKRFAQRAHLAK